MAAPKKTTKYFAKLVKGKTYALNDRIFHADQEVEVSKKEYDYLNGNENFDVREGDDDPAATPSE